MTRDDIIRMAREAGFVEYLLRVYRAEEGVEKLARAAYAAGAAAEREACCRIVTGLCISDNNAAADRPCDQSKGREMTHEELKRLATECFGMYTDLAKDFARAVAEAEREACAKVADLVAREIDDTNGTATYIAAAIRARGQQSKYREENKEMGPMRKGVKQIKINALSFAKLTALMLDGGLTRKEMAEETGLHYVTILRYCRGLRKEGILRIDGWRTDAYGRMNVATYKLVPARTRRRPSRPSVRLVRTTRPEEDEEMIQRMAG
jgi:transcriptional regulator with XRE-family HTH domain